MNVFPGRDQMENELKIAMETDQAAGLLQRLEAARTADPVLRDIRILLVPPSVDDSELSSPDPAWVEIGVAFFGSVVVAAAIRGTLDVIKEYITSRADVEMTRVKSKTPVVIRFQDKELTIPAHLSTRERNKLLQRFLKDILKLYSQASSDTTETTQ